MSKEMSFLESVNKNIESACEFLHLNDATTQTLLTPKQELTVHFNVKMDDGKMKRFTGFRIQHSSATGPGKGGIRYHPAETIDTVRSLASMMHWKVNLAGLPLSGAKGGIVCDVKNLSKSELEGVTRAYTRAIADVIGDHKDIPAPDVYTDGQIMSWILDEFETIVRHSEPGVITGKPLVLGGSKGRGDATAMGGIFALREASKVLNINLDKTTFAVQGFGNAGQNFAILAQDMMNMHLIGVSDSKGAIVALRDTIIDAHLLDAWKAKTGSVVGFKNTVTLSRPEELLEISVGVLVPSALENVITIDNAEKVNARIIVELANGPTTTSADEILYNKGIHIIPDFLANSGGVTVSHLESVQNRQSWYWSESDIYKILDQKITEMYQNTYKISIEEKINMRKAAFILSVSRVCEALKLRGEI